MARILITGMSGAGKSTLLAELATRGYTTVDTDYGSWITNDGLWDEEKIMTLLHGSSDIVICGTVDNQGTFYDLFDHIVLLSAPTEVLIERVRTRTNNPYGRTIEQQEEIRCYVKDVEPLLRGGATLELDGQRSVTELADVVETLMK